MTVSDNFQMIVVFVRNALGSTTCRNPIALWLLSLLHQPYLVSFMKVLFKSTFWYDLGSTCLHIWNQIKLKIQILTFFFGGESSIPEIQQGFKMVKPSL